MAIISISFVPEPTVSPTALPISDFATGEANEMEPCLRIRSVLANNNNAKLLCATVQSIECHCASKGDDVRRRGIGKDLTRSQSLGKVSRVTNGDCRKSPFFIDVVSLLSGFVGRAGFMELSLQGLQTRLSYQIGMG